jgi:tripartite-type tricarboxylate transporter receptor subunit TctC
MPMKPALMYALLLSGATLYLQPCTALPAQPAYPTKPVRMVVSSSPGGGPDIVARLVAAKLSEALGQQVVVDNRAGAGTMIGNEMVARAAPDGYTVLMAGAAVAINPAMMKNPSFDAVKDFAAVSQVVSLPFILVVHPSVPAKSVKELVALSKARPGQLNFASGGIGSSPHLAMALFLSMTRTSMVHIPYKGTGVGVIDLLAGQVTVMMPNLLTALPYLKTGKLRALGVTSAKRASAVPDVPAIAEAGVPGYEAVQWYGVLAPAGTPKEIVVRLSTEIARVMQLPEIRDRLATEGAEAVGNSPDQFAAFIKSEVAKWTKVIHNAGIKPE